MPADLATQELFEELWFHKEDSTPLPGMRPKDRAWIVYHTASWCGPCKNLNVPMLDEAAKSRGLTIWKCDVTKNEYTSGYCGVRSVPTFQFCIPRKMISTLQSSDTAKVIEWILSL